MSCGTSTRKKIMTSGLFAIGTFAVMFTLMVVAQQVLARLQRVPRPKQLIRLPNEKWLRLFAFFAISMMPLYQLDQIPTPFFAIGAVIMLCGAALMLWAQYTLGKNWIPGAGIHKSHKLVMDGPYSKVRHPLYTAIGMFWIGGAIATLNFGILIAGVFLWLSMAIRVPSEENLMRQKFKKRWEQYQASTAMFFPRLHD